MKNEIKRTGTARKVGRPRAYTPEALEAKFEEYVEWVKANPVYINKVSAGEIIPVPTQRPLTLVGFCQFAKISRQNFYEYESREEFSDILNVRARGYRGGPAGGRIMWTVRFGNRCPGSASCRPSGCDHQRQGDNDRNAAYFRGPRPRSGQDHPVHRQADSKGMTGHAACDDARHRITTK